MNTCMLTRVRRHFDRPGVPHHVKRHNMRAWVKSIRHLGDRWLLARPINSPVEA